MEEREVEEKGGEKNECGCCWSIAPHRRRSRSLKGKSESEGKSKRRKASAKGQEREAQGKRQGESERLSEKERQEPSQEARAKGVAGQAAKKVPTLNWASTLI